MSRKRMFKDIPGFDDYLRRTYCEEKKTMAQIAEELDCSPAAVLGQLRRCGIETRKSYDYETSENVREAWRKLGHATKGRRLTDEQKAAISRKATGRRKRDDYEFGGHEKKRDDGYIAVYCPQHPNANREGYVMKHRFVMERALGITLSPDYVVHHINHVRDDNRLENLALMTFGAHAALHMAERHSRRKAS